MASMFEFKVEMDDDSTYLIVTDQRDLDKWEVQPFGGPSTETKPGVRWMRFLAWSASTRQQITTLPWSAWNDKCVEVGAPEDEEGQGIPEDAEDPGQPAR